MAAVIYDTNDGRAVSVGQVVADPLPPGLAEHELSSADFDGLRGGWRTWDAATRAVVATPGWVDPAAAEAADTSNRQQLAQALAVLDRLADGKAWNDATVTRTTAAHANVGLTALATIVRRLARVTAGLAADRTD